MSILRVISYFKCFVFVFLATLGVFFFSGCASLDNMFGYRVIKPEVQENDVVKKTYVKKLVPDAENYGQILNKIYATKITGEPPYKIGMVRLANRYKGGYHLDINIFQTYCSDKGGSVYRWNYAQTLSNEFYSCEIDGSVDSALDFTSVNDPAIGDTSNLRMLYYLGKKQFADYVLRQNHLRGDKIHYLSDNRVLDFSQKNRSICKLVVSYRNREKEPITINLSNSFLAIGGVKYSIQYNDNTATSSLTINPNEEYRHIFDVTIGGLADRQDFSDMVIVIDNKLRGDRFTRINDYEKGIYDMNKVKLQDI